MLPSSYFYLCFTHTCTYPLVSQCFAWLYPTLEPTLEPTLNATLVFMFYPQRTLRSRRFFHEEHDWQLSLLESLQQESVASCSDAPQCLQRFTCITLCRRIGGRYSPKFGNGVFLFYLCSWNLRGSHQTIHVVRFIRVIITWFLVKPKSVGGNPKTVFFSADSSAGSVWVSV